MGAPVLITGTKGFTNRGLVSGQVDRVPKDCVVLTGSTRTVDEWVKDAGLRRGLEVRVFRTKWSEHSGDCGCDPRAGYCRFAGIRAATSLVNAANYVVLFDDGHDPAGAIIIDLAARAGLVGPKGDGRLRIIAAEGAPKRTPTAEKCADCGTVHMLRYRDSGRPVLCGTCYYARKRVERATSEGAFDNFLDPTEILLPSDAGYSPEFLDYPAMEDWSELETWEVPGSRDQDVRRRLSDILYP